MEGILIQLLNMQEQDLFWSVDETFLKLLTSILTQLDFDEIGFISHDPIRHWQ